MVGTMNSTRKGWEHFEHVADIGVHGFGPTQADAFEQAALAMTAVAVDPGSVQAVEEIEIECAAPKRELLLADWLNALVFEAGTRGMLFGAFRVEIDGNTLRATASGEPIDIGRHRPAAEVKGATLTALDVSQSPDGLWHARCVVDV